MLGILGFLRKVPIWMWLIAIGAGYVAWSQHQIGNLKAEVTLSRLATDSTTQLNDSLFARIAVDGILKDSLGGAIAAANELNADLIAAARLVVTPDTVAGDTVLVPTIIDSTRIATISDTTEGGVLDATITAPPFPADIGFRYSFAPAPIDLVVSLLRVADNTAIFAVTYRGGSAEISAPYARLPVEPPRAFAYLDGMYNVTGGFAVFRGGAQLRLFRWLGTFAELSQDFQEESTARLNIGGRIQIKLF